MKRATKEEKAQATLDLLLLSGIYWVNSLEAFARLDVKWERQRTKVIRGSVDVVCKSLLMHQYFNRGSNILAIR